ncbi:TraM recognition domain-containing protein, partial [Patescibacteria group bacterium]|nr:TraM recognition domain-containing protein [Patescibacteria group bacterium]
NVVKNFWTNEFASWSEKFDSEAIMPILNKIGQFLSTTIIRNIVSQEDNKVVMSEIMDSRKILLVKLPKGILGEENTSLLGSMIITKIYQSALARANSPESERIPFFMYVDEFQNFATDSFANILSESRKYKLSLTVAHQYISQLPTQIKNTIFGNVGSLLSFRIGPEDAAMLEREFEPRFKANDIINLAVQDIYLKMSIDDEVKEAFSARVLNVPASQQTFKEQIREYTRSHYCKPQEVAEQEIRQEKSKELELLEALQKQEFSAPML